MNRYQRRREAALKRRKKEPRLLSNNEALGEIGQHRRGGMPVCMQRLRDNYRPPLDTE